MKTVVTMNAVTMDVARDAAAHLVQAVAVRLALAVRLEALVQAEAVAAADAQTALCTMEANAYVILLQNVENTLVTTQKLVNVVLISTIGTGANALAGSRMNFANKQARAGQKQTLQNVLANVQTDKRHV